MNDPIFDGNEQVTQSHNFTNAATDGIETRSSCGIYTTPVDMGANGGWQLVDLFNCHAEDGGFTNSRYIDCKESLQSVYLSGEGSDNALFTWPSNDCEIDWNDPAFRMSIIADMWSIVREDCPKAVIVDIEFFVNFCPCGQDVYNYYLGFEATVCCNPNLKPFKPYDDYVAYQVPAMM